MQHTKQPDAPRDPAAIPHEAFTAPVAPIPPEPMSLFVKNSTRTIALKHTPGATVKIRKLSSGEYARAKRDAIPDGKVIDRLCYQKNLIKAGLISTSQTPDDTKIDDALIDGLSVDAIDEISEEIIALTHPTSCIRDLHATETLSNVLDFVMQARTDRDDSSIGHAPRPHGQNGDRDGRGCEQRPKKRLKPLHRFLSGRGGACPHPFHVGCVAKRFRDQPVASGN